LEVDYNPPVSAANLLAGNLHMSCGHHLVGRKKKVAFRPTNHKPCAANTDDFAGLLAVVANDENRNRRPMRRTKGGDGHHVVNASKSVQCRADLLVGLDTRLRPRRMRF
jgi:hypothetical protein